MASQYNYSRLPSYADDVKAPLLSERDQDGVVINIHPVDTVPQDENTCARRCGGGRGFFGRMRARCAARRLQKYGPPCENEGCVRAARRRRIFRRIIFSLLSLFVLVHLVKGAYVLYTLPSRVHCVPITDPTSTYELPHSRKLFLDYSLTTGTTTIAHGAGNSTSLQLSFQDVSESDGLVLCSAAFKRGAGVGVYTKDKNATLPRLVEAVITLPEGDGPMIKFGSKRAARCAGHVVRKVLKWKKGEEGGDEA